MSALETRTADSVITVTLNRPPVNALDVELCTDLTAVFESLIDSASAQCVILAAAGQRAFCAGLDFRAFFDSATDHDSRNALLRRLYAAVYDCPVPVIAAIERPAIGAGSVLAAVCDIRIAAATATFTLPEINVGRVGGAAHHSRLMPQGSLRRMVFTGAAISASEAHRIGFVDELVPTDALTAAIQLALVISAKSPLALRHAKRGLNEVEGLSAAEGYELEQRRSAVIRDSDDAREAARALLEKRPPVFHGR